MGWLYMRSLEGHATPKAYLDAQFTYDRDTGRSRVLASSVVGRRTYYAAVEWISAGTEAREVWGLVCLVRHNPGDREGLVFGYKDMSESMGPCESDCPARILDLLTATENTYALAWRERCRARLSDRSARAAKPTPKPGDVVVLAEPILLRGGLLARSAARGSRLSQRAGRALSHPQAEGSRLHHPTRTDHDLGVAAALASWSMAAAPSATSTAIRPSALRSL